VLEEWAPIDIQENYDNSGLLVGDKTQEIKNVLISLDCTEAVVDEAIQKGCQLIVAHHPIIFSGLKRLTESSYVERTVSKAIKNNIALYAIHTNLDNINTGVNKKIADLIGLKNVAVLQPKSQMLKKIVTFIPESSFEIVTNALFSVGCGQVGNYSNAGFYSRGKGTFKGNDFSNPAIGQKNQLEEVDEIRWEAIFPSYLLPQVISTLKKHHPYEEVAYHIIDLNIDSQDYGIGMMGYLEESMDLNDFLLLLKQTFHCPAIKYTTINTKVKTVAVCGGSGASLISIAKSKQVDAYVTSDVKYHDFFDAESKLSVIDIGHYESEQFTKQIIFDYLKNKVVSLHLEISEISTNPINYFI
jgi:dinuclear metal center YbgI/SA1388 family protein